jgi:hypothetical protein
MGGSNFYLHRRIRIHIHHGKRQSA